MHYLGIIMISISCLVIAFQDFRTQLIHGAWILLLFGGAFISINSSIYYLYPIILMNLSFLLILLLVLKMYTFYRGGAKIAFINGYMGAGDLLILCAFCFLVNLHNYVLLLLVSCLSGLIYWIVRKAMTRRQVIPIPLAGFLTVAYFLVQAFALYHAYDLFSNILILHA